MRKWGKNQPNPRPLRENDRENDEQSKLPLCHNAVCESFWRKIKERVSF